MMRNAYPHEIQQTIAAFSPVAGAWATASGLTLDDVRQELAAAVLAGLDPAAAVPRALGIRRVAGAWRSCDPAAAAGELGDFDAVSEDDELLGEDASGIAVALAGGSEAVAGRCGVGRRAAQMRIAAQAERFALSGDLFVGGEA